MLNHLRNLGFSDAEIEGCGVIGKNDKGKLYDKLRNRITFAISDRKNRLIAFGGRTLGDDLPKYLNSAETEIFKKNPYVDDTFLNKVLQNISGFLSLKCLKNDESIMTYENIDFLFEYPFLQDYIKADILSFNPDHPFQQYQLEAGAGAKKGEIKMLPKIDRKLKLDSYQSETNPFFTYQWTYVNDNTSTNSVTTNLKYKFEQSFEDQTPYEFTTSSGRSYKFIPFCFIPLSVNKIHGIVIDKANRFVFKFLKRERTT